MDITSAADADEWDRNDPLRNTRDAFVLPPGKIYLDGNSLGPLPKATLARQGEIVAGEWGQGLIGSWNDAGWMAAPARIGAKISKLIGAADDEVIVADSTSVNLFKLVVAALRLRPGRRIVLTEQANFPTDLHVAEGAAACVPGCAVRAVPSKDLVPNIGDDVALVLLTHVHYRSGVRHDMRALTCAAHDAGALMLWDLSHSAGAVEVNLGVCNADFAVGCGYKFLNGGPGAPAYLYVARHLQEKMQSPLQGWLGHAAPFAFADHYKPAEGIARFLCGTPPILSLCALESGLDLWPGLDRATLFAKSRRLFDLFLARVEALCPGLALLTPRHAEARGSHIAFAHPHGYAVMQALIARGVIGDFRAPDVLRFGLTPLYLGFADVWRATQILSDVLRETAWTCFSQVPGGKVT